MRPPPIITCPQWGARPPREPPTFVGAPDLGVVHHTAGLAPHADTPRDEAIAYAHLLQDDMIDRRGWNDSGHNFLVMRSGIIIQGRWGTVTAIERGGMVVSAHCPGENTNPGVEHEHVDGTMTAEQFSASADLWAWICWHTGIKPTRLYPHRQFFATDCPGALEAQIPALRLAVAHRLTTARGAIV